MKEESVLQANALERTERDKSTLEMELAFYKE